MNQRLVKIVETKDAPCKYYISQLMDAKLKPILTKLNNISNVTSGKATSQQRGEEGVFPEVNINNPHQTSPMEKKIEKIKLKKRTWKEKLKNLREKKTGQKGNQAFGLGKGKVKIVYEKEDELIHH